MNREGEKERGIEKCIYLASLTNSLISSRHHQQAELEANGENIDRRVQGEPTFSERIDKDSISICPSESECNANGNLQGTIESESDS
jgi:hypothetical protein